ncbi:hypothetical protein H6G41_25045 [Tolypothrix sp. FACHB-123]|uniref:hypothetical protein n=1 Tax=Tolypothrix sp. FACHB-123 TaxID=2692868 RepID=UPI0016856893|nr:hypothetical protein [Tolypothrix sp. FACHB-123]MBD2357838.1 hypothetical protein [Tolypothrix sp. FACHB-123]
MTFDLLGSGTSLHLLTHSERTSSHPQYTISLIYSNARETLSVTLRKPPRDSAFKNSPLTPSST